MEGIVRKTSIPAYGAGVATGSRLNPLGELVAAPSVLQWIMDGRVYCASDADENDRVVGLVTFAVTTPDFLLRVPDGTAALPLWVSLAQAGTVAGGDVSVYLSYDRVDRYSSGGTSEAISHMRTDRPRAPACTLFSLATAAAATDARLLYASGDMPAVAGTGTADVAQALHLRAFVDFFPPLLVGPAAFMVLSSTTTTGASWEWSIGWAEFAESDVV